MPPESDFRDTYGYMCSFLHEAGHATGAPGRLGRGFGSTREEYAIEEPACGNRIGDDLPAGSEFR